MTDESADTNSSNYLAALDIGSNSFHFVLARQVGEHLQILHSEKYRVQLAQGLTPESTLTQAAIERGLSTLENLATTTHHIHPDNFRVVATYTLRQATNSSQFLRAAASIFPFKIEIISGHEEARLIYQGVAHHRQNDTQQLVLDIGGGSTECIIGKKYKVKGLDSLNMGCVSFQQQFFADGIISQDAFDSAIRAAKHQVDAIIKRFKKLGWQQVTGTSGTIKAVTRLVNYNSELERPFNLKDLKSIKKQLIACKQIQHIDLPGLKEARREVICSGVAILIALMERLDINEIEYCKYALREGVLFEQLETLKHNNVRTRTIESFVSRFNIDAHHAANVKTLANTLFKQAKSNWKLSEPIYQELLFSAIQLHEIGIDINASGYQKHGQYILEQADMAGFNQEQQKALAWLVGNQRKKVTPLEPESWYLLSPNKLLKICIIIRLSVLLNQQRHSNDSFMPSFSATKNTMILGLDRQWLLDRPIIDTELFYEQGILEKLKFTLTVTTDPHSDED